MKMFGGVTHIALSMYFCIHRSSLAPTIYLPPRATRIYLRGHEDEGFDGGASGGRNCSSLSEMYMPVAANAVSASETRKRVLAGRTAGNGLTV